MPVIVDRHTTCLLPADLEKGVIILFDKEYRWTSFDVVKKVKSIISNRLKIKKLKIGHAGTLDPLATGLLIVCTGKMTKQIESLQNTMKEYIATLEFGKTTPCFDLEQPYDKEYPFEHITRSLLEEKLSLFIGETAQVPPLFSAKLVKGKRAYDLARKGDDVQLKPAKIFIEKIEILEFNLPILKIRVVCSKGTYIRALARDIGFAVGSGAHLVALRRTVSGDFNVENAIKIGFFEKIVLPLQA